MAACHPDPDLIPRPDGRPHRESGHRPPVLRFGMSFGRNPHVAKAEAAEQKARSARDETARKQAWRESAHQWDRAASRETDDKRRESYAARAEAARASADHAPTEDAEAGVAARQNAKSTLLN